MKRLLFAAFLMAGVSAWAQPTETKAQFEKEYKERIQKETLYGQYIPIDLTDAFVQLNKLIDSESKVKFKMATEEEAAHKLYFSFGRWIIENWGFYGGSRLSHYIKALGITFPEDMAQFIIVSYHRNLNKKELHVKEQATYYKEMRRKEHEERVLQGKVIKEETRIVKGKQ